ncbi:MAG: acyl-CoA desaturase [Pseudomonadota bacterium]
MTSRPASAARGDIAHPAAIPFVLIHLGCIGAIWSGVTWPAVVLGAGLYVLRMFAITAGYHRYFSHRAFVTGRVFQFVLATLAQSAGQKSVLWWAAHHRLHHLHSDTEHDPHSPTQGGFFRSHIGWVLDRRNDATDMVKVEDFAVYPELRWLHRYEALPPILLAVLCFVVAGWPGLVVGFCWSTVAVYHATFAINSIAHVHGQRRYVTGDHSRNNPVLAIATLGEGWHNNHHAYPASARNGFRWWELDLTYSALTALAALGVVSELKTPPLALVRNEHRLGNRVVRRAAEQLAARFDPITTAHSLQRALGPITAQQVGHALQQPGNRPETGLGALPGAPTRADFVDAAASLFGPTVSFDDIIEHALKIFFVAVGERLAQTIPAPVDALGAPRAYATTRVKS